MVKTDSSKNHQQMLNRLCGKGRSLKRNRILDCLKISPLIITKGNTVTMFNRETDILTRLPKLISPIRAKRNNVPPNVIP